MKTADFDFVLPAACIAEHPARPRDGARLLVVRGAGEDRLVRDLPALLQPGDLLVFNDTRVIPARLVGVRGAARIEVTLHKRTGPGQWRAFARPAKRLRPGQVVVFAPDLAATVQEKFDTGDVALAFGLDDAGLMAALQRYGRVPLPPYIRRADGPEPGDVADYQTLFAAVDGAVAAPTAGLHFTPALMAALAQRGVAFTTVTLHVGAGTFLPVKVEELSAHRMHSEVGILGAEAIAAIEAARRAGGRVIAVGTTTLRLLESVALACGTLRPFSGETDLFITPGFPFRVIDRLLTNFHLPRSTLFMLTCAFAGTERVRAAYAHAIATGYRFYSYGDACLLDREPHVVV